MPVVDRRTRLKVRRLLRRQKSQLESVTAQADDGINRHVLRRFGNLIAVRRFVLAWTAFVFLLGIGAIWQVRGMDKHYLTTAPASGGIYREGIIGSLTNVNPMFATTSVDTAAARLIFSGLFKVSPSGRIVGNLAKDYKVSDNGKTYTISLRDNVRWHDGESFSADDVLFTYKSIQNADARSPLYESWRGVSITKIDDHTVEFTIPNVLSSFPYALTNGIVPRHLLENVVPTDLRSASFNSRPIGTGPYVFKTIEIIGSNPEERQERLALTKNAGYFEPMEGPEGVVLQSYRSEEAMLEDFDAQAVQSMVGLTSLPEEYSDTEDVKVVSAPLTSAVMAFFNNSSPYLNDPKVRAALVQSVRTDELRSVLGYSAVAVDSPFLKSHFTYDETITQRPFDFAHAQALLDDAGWTLQDGIRTKEGQKLKLRLVSQSLSEYTAITQKLQQSWKELGIEVDVMLQPEADVQSGAIARHDYDVLLYGISIGYDPDVFVYWHSSQVDPNAPVRLNLSEYKNDTADEALEAGRTRVDQSLRKVKYKPFLEVWRDEAPALAIYQPRFLMVVRGTFEGFEDGQLSTATDRFYSIGNWKIRNAVVVK